MYYAVLFYDLHCVYFCHLSTLNHCFQTSCNMYNDFLPRNMSDRNDDLLPNNSPGRSPPPRVPRSQPRIVNNLSYLAAHDRYGMPTQISHSPITWLLFSNIQGLPGSIHF